MKTVLGQWGNATGLRIPVSLCNQLGFVPGQQVDIQVEGNHLKITRDDEQFTLKALMKDWDGVRYRSKEFDLGEPAGQEIW